MTNRTKAIASLTGVFILGALCGGLALGLFVRSEVRDRDRLKDPEGFREYFADELSLSQAQRDSLESELAVAYEQIEDIRYQVELEYGEVFDTLTGRLIPTLNTRQRRLLADERKRLLPERKRGRRDGSRPMSLEEIDREIEAGTDFVNVETSGIGHNGGLGVCNNRNPL